MCWDLLTLITDEVLPRSQPCRRREGTTSRRGTLYGQVLEIYRKAVGEAHSAYAASLTDLALVNESQNDYARAEPALRQALQMREKSLGELSPAYAQSLNYLAGLYRAQGDDGRAEPLCREARNL